MAILPLNLSLQDAQGNALSGAIVYICKQPASTGTIPPSPLATVYSDLEGDPGSNPVTTDGYGKAQPYVSTLQMPFTIVYTHPLFVTPVIEVDQYPPGSASGSVVTPVTASTSAGTITGAVNGTNKTFVLPSVPSAGSLNWYYNGVGQIQGVGYTISGATVTTAIAPEVGDTLSATYLT